MEMVQRGLKTAPSSVLYGTDAGIVAKYTLQTGHWRYMSEFTQEKSHLCVQCVRKVSHTKVIWQNILWLYTRMHAYKMLGRMMKNRKTVYKDYILTFCRRKTTVYRNCIVKAYSRGQMKCVQKGNVKRWQL